MTLDLSLDLTALLAIYAAVVSTVVLLVQVADFARGSDDLSLRISHGYVFGGMPGVPEHVVQVTIASRGIRPVGVNGLVIALTGGLTIPLTNYLPLGSSRALPAVLGRGDSSTYWVDHDRLEAELRRSGHRIRRLEANLADGSTTAARVPGHWKRLGGS